MYFSYEHSALVAKTQIRPSVISLQGCAAMNKEMNSKIHVTRVHGVLIQTVIVNTFGEKNPTPNQVDHVTLTSVSLLIYMPCL